MNTGDIIARLHLVLALAVLLTIVPQATAADVVLRGIQVSVPKGYERSDRPKGKEAEVFVRKGDGKGALAKLLPQTQFDSIFLKDWFHNNTVAYLSIQVLDRPQEQRSLSADEMQWELGRQLTSQWGHYSFSLPISDRGIGWFVNYAGAFVAISTRMVDDKMVVIESMDLVQLLAAEETIPSKTDGSAQEYWNFFRGAANAEDAESVLVSARRATNAGRP